MLAELYRVGQMAFVSACSLSNVLEPAAHGLPLRLVTVLKQS